jgi:PPOX class probable F420-dependent enzyme
MQPTARSSYVALTSYTRDGRAVTTPVWVVADGDALAIWTARSSYKVKRISRNPTVTVAACTFRGRVLGPAVPGRAQVMDGAGLDRVRHAIMRKYWLTGPLTVLGSRLRRRKEPGGGSVGIRIELTEN